MSGVEGQVQDSAENFENALNHFFSRCEKHSIKISMHKLQAAPKITFGCVNIDTLGHNKILIHMIQKL